jgi:S1-C subfamily serine protease
MIREHRKQGMRHSRALLQLMTSAVLLLLIGPKPVGSKQQAAGVPASGPKVKMVRSVAGTKGDSRGGSFVMADPRTTFFVPDDRQIIVYFEWEAPRGTHHCEGTLHGPNGQLVVMQSFDYPATQARFGGFWKIPLLEETSAGMWSFESHVDGESAGALSFEVVAGKRPEDFVRKEPPLPTAAEIYARAVTASAFIEKLDDKGRSMETASGFFLENGLLLTAFRAIDGAHALRIRLSDGSQIQSDTVLAWNRRQDWALLNVAAGKSAKLHRADTKSVAVGDRCYWLDTKPDGARVISDGQIAGTENHEGWGDRLSISGTFDSTATGGPVLNDQGEVLGLLGGTIPEPRVYSAGDTFTATGSVVPIGLANADLTGTLAPLQTLWSTNQFTAPITAGRNISFGMITHGKPQKGKVPFPKEMKVDFSARDDFATVVAAFQAMEPLRDIVQLQIYDVDNHPVTRGDPIKINLRTGETQERSWSFPLNMRPGIYRADVLVGQEVGWRQYFRISE